ncbi:CCHC-type domain-containing protein [Heracleum sosnowskyi]|uniref:CCHC-type domain-containing protein n=1 Tax=Heracleum sosnowskyi TaxID=360622 RepID=A0AAD8GVH7_9APIA|nr:CCHC-type domain-containing protein [Heracleum sosnowskyi]
MASTSQPEDHQDHHQDDAYSVLDSSLRSVALQNSHPLYLHPSDHPGQVLVAATLTGENFNEWKRFMTLALSAKNKLGFVTGKYKAPGITSAYFDHWQRCNDMIITWILNSLSPDIRSSLVYVTLAEDVWTDLHTRFAHNNGPRIFELKRAISDLSQDTLTISVYYTKFKQLHDDLHNVAHVPKCTCECVCNAKADIDQHEEIMKVTQFLMGLNENVTNIRGQLLMMSLMPRITQVLALLQQEERQRSYRSVQSSTVESVSLAASRQYSQFSGSNNRFNKFNDSRTYSSGKSFYKKGNLECSYRHGTNHTKDMCYRLIGFPPRSKQAGSSQNKSHTTVVAQVQSDDTSSGSEDSQITQNQSISLSNTLSPTQYQQLLFMLNQASTTTSNVNAITTVTETPQSAN